MKRKQEQTHGPLWNWLHDDLRKDEAKNALKRKKVRKVHRHRYNLCACCQESYYGYCCCAMANAMCECGKVRP